MSRVGRVTRSQPSPRISATAAAHPPQLAVERGRGHGLAAGAVPAAALGRIGAEEHGDRGQAAGPGQLQVAAAPRRLQAERVDDRGQAAAQPGRHDVVQQGERVVRRVQVVLTAADHGPQPVGRDHLLRAVPLAAQPTCRNRRARPAPRARDREARTAVPSSVGSTAPAWQTLGWDRGPGQRDMG